MSKPLGVVWDLEPHTAKKHELLRRYFEAWLPIMARWNGRVVYIDGFAGPGRYSKGEDGSPVIVLKAARDHSYPTRTELACIFVEDDPNRYQHLKAILDELAPSLPASIKWEAVPGKFDEHLTKTFNILDAQAKAIAPSLVFIDPSWEAGHTMKCLLRLLSIPFVRLHENLRIVPSENVPLRLFGAGLTTES